MKKKGLFYILTACLMLLLNLTSSFSYTALAAAGGGSASSGGGGGGTGGSSGGSSPGTGSFRQNKDNINRINGIPTTESSLNNEKSVTSNLLFALVQGIIVVAIFFYNC